MQAGGTRHAAESVGHHRSSTAASQCELAAVGTGRREGGGEEEGLRRPHATPHHVLPAGCLAAPAVATHSTRWRSQRLAAAASARLLSREIPIKLLSSQYLLFSLTFP